MRLRRLVCLLLMPIPAWALPDAPVAKSTAEHRFYDRPGKLLLTAALTAAATDTAQTCRNLARGGREVFLPTQSCPQVNLFLFGEVLAQEGVAYLLHRHGRHKLERLIRLASITDNVSGLVYSRRHGAW